MKKKIVVLLLTLICILGLTGCGKKYEGPLSCISYTDFAGTVSLMDMPEEVHEEILAVLNGGVWHNDMSKCESDFSFETKNETIYYHSECGSFNDATNKRYMTLSESERTKINQLLGAEPSVVKTYEKTPSEHAFENDELCILAKHYEMSDGTWKTDKHTYKYRLEITGRQPNAVKDSTYVYLSNIETITFRQAMMASGLSSNISDYFDPEVATLVAMK